MKKCFVFLAGFILFSQISYAQSTIITSENFDNGATNFSPNPSRAWQINNYYFVSPSNSYRGKVPNIMGDSSILTTVEYNLKNYSHVLLKFNHICKISFHDNVRIEYKTGNQGWNPIPANTYLGKATNYGITGFNSLSYPEWNYLDSSAIPTQSWWKEELFDIGFLVGGFDGVQFRFIIKRGTAQGTNISYGWLLDNFTILAANHEINPPVVEFIDPYPVDTIYTTGPFGIRAKVKSQTATPVENPWLKYTVTYNGIQVKTDSILMNNISGDSIWGADLPHLPAGNQVSYSITGKDLIGNSLTAMSGYIIVANNKNDIIVQGNGTSGQSSPFRYDFAYSRSMVLYNASEIDFDKGGDITNLALRVYSKGSGPFPMKVWLKTIPVSKTQWNAYTDNADWSDLTQDATLVYDGNLYFAAEGWVEIPLSKHFYYSGTENLVVMFEQNCGSSSYMRTPPVFYNIVKLNSVWLKYSNISPNESTTLFTGSYRPDLRIGLNEPTGNNSVKLLSIEVKDTIAITPNVQVPIVATIWNKGLSNLDSVLVSYSINNSIPVQTPWYGSLPWDYKKQDTIGYYSPSQSAYDTLVVWVSFPNGQQDAITYDDTLTKIIYAYTDLNMKFVNYYKDTVNSIGPYSITAQINSITGASTGLVDLYIAVTLDGTTDYDTISMLYNASQNLWEATIQRYPFGSSVQYSITLTDIAGNTVSISENYYIKRTGEETPNSVKLASIETPVEGAVIEGSEIPVHVKIQNKGINNLTSCILNWSINGELQLPADREFIVDLPDDFTDTITIGSYTPVSGKKDTIMVWVSAPNNATDPDESDDTLQVVVLGCVEMPGVLTINGYNSEKISDVLATIRNCGLTGDLTIQLKGRFSENVNLGDLSKHTNGYKLTITSADNHRDSAVIKPGSGIGITLGNSSSIEIKAITIDVSSLTAANTAAIRFNNTCNNILIDSCNLKANATTSTASIHVISKGENTGIVDNIRIINNIISGGCSGIDFYGGTGTDAGNYGTHVVFENNTIGSQRNYGINTYYTDFTSCSYNTIENKTSSVNNSWIGIAMTSCNGSIIGNRVKSTISTTPRGISIERFNYYNTTDIGLIANNEIIMSTGTGVSFGTHTTLSHANILNNSINITGTGSARGLYITNSADNILSIKNNNIVLTGSTAYPIYYSANPTGSYDTDWNNLCAPTNLGYAGGAITDMTAWQGKFLADIHSIRINPVFSNTTTLELSNTIKNMELTCEFIPLVDKDKNRNNRTATTIMGCYEIAVEAGSAMMTEIIGLGDGRLSGQTDDVKVVVCNTGTTPLSSINLEWSISGSPQNAGGTDFPVSLETYEFDTIPIGEIRYTPGDLTIKAWINNLNEGALTDNNEADDTLSVSIFACGGGYGGSLSVPGAEFTELQDALNAIYICGLATDLTLNLKGSYDKFDLSNIADCTNGHILTITSSDNHPNSVVIKALSGAGIVLSNTRNVVLKAITVDVSTVEIPAIQFAGACTNIIIRDCNLLGNTTTNASAGTNAPISKISSTTAPTGIVDSIFIINNVLDGGYRGFYFCGGTNANNLGTNILFDSNTVSNQHSFAIHSYYTDFISCSYNTIQNRTANTNKDWKGIAMSSGNGSSIVGNKINSTVSTTPRGIEIQDFNPASSGLIANNEIKMNTEASFGIYVNTSSCAMILNNSIHITGTGAPRGIHIEDNRSNIITIKNNNIVLASSSANPIYYSTATLTGQYVTDWNNLYAPNNIGFIGSAITSMNVWQSLFPADLHSVRTEPDFVGNTLKLANVNANAGLVCDLIPPVTHDIDGITRANKTTMGCYLMKELQGNAMLTEIVGLRDGYLAGENDSVKVIVYNTGTASISSINLEWSLDGTPQNTGGTDYSVALGQYESDTISIGKIEYASDDFTIKAWINNLNGGALTDDNKTDDTTSISISLCSDGYGGIHTIPGAEFATIENAIDAIRTCGLKENLTLQLKGAYGQIDLSDLNRMNGYILTITSADNHPDSVIIRPVSGSGIIFSNARNIELNAITVNVSSSTTSAIQFTSACTNIVIRDCKLFAHSSSTSTTIYAPIYKANTTGVVDSIFIINNTLNGGYSGFYFYGGSNAVFGTNIVFDSNTVSNQYYHGIYAYNTDFTSCSYNIIENRTASAYASWNGIAMTSCNASVIANRINSATSNTPRVINLKSFNQFYTIDAGFIANNEIIMNTNSTGASYAIYIDTVSHVTVLNNSINNKGTGPCRGIHIQDNKNNILTIKNNNIALLGSNASPIYYSVATPTGQYITDWNNLYAPVNIGYTGTTTAITSMAAWQDKFPADLHSVRINPVFSKTSTLELIDTISNMELICDVIPPVTQDMNKVARMSKTTMGCYEMEDAEGAVMITEIIGLRDGTVPGQNDSVKIIVYNTGTTSLSSINLEWSINGESQNTNGSDFMVSLVKYEFDTIAIGKIQYTPGDFTIKAWINNLNNANLTDNKKTDDTVSTFISICPDGYSGRYTVPGAEFASIGKVLDAIRLCGLANDLVLELKDTLRENVDLRDISNYTNGHKLTITSVDNHPDNAVIRPDAGIGIILGNTNNIELKAITVDLKHLNVANTYAIQFVNACSDIVIDSCNIKVDSTTSTNSIHAIFKAENTGIVDNIHITNNTIDGGYSGFYFYGGTGETAYGTNIVFDNNTVSNQYYLGIYPSYTDFRSCSYNTFLSRSTNIYNYWYAIRMYNGCNGPVVGNRIHQRNNSIKYPIGIYLDQHNSRFTTDKGLVVNNEIILSSNETSTTSGGIRIASSHSDIINNSIYISGTGAIPGVLITNTTGNSIVLKNNNITTISTNANTVPIHFNTTGNLDLYDMDYNNLYAPSNNVVFYGSNMDLAIWKQTMTTDQHSVRVLPIFSDPTTNLELTTYNDSLFCSRLDVDTDIRGEKRSYITTMGAYTQPPLAFDLALSGITPWNAEIIENQMRDITANIANTGAIPIEEATFGWSLNGDIQPSVSWTASPTLGSLETRNITITSFQATNADTFNIVVWTETINGQPDTVHLFDTVSASTVMVPVAEFVSPYITDTIQSLSFDVNVLIRSLSGAPAQAPGITLETRLEGLSLSFYDTIAMVPLQDDIWQANIPRQYYNSKVIYSLTVSDAIGNTSTLIDSVSIINFMKIIESSDTLTIGSGVTSFTSSPQPYHAGVDLGWSRSIYMNWEIDPDKTGKIINSIAYYNTNTATPGSTVEKLSVYFKAVSDSVFTLNDSYEDPIAKGASLVWGKATHNSTFGWNLFVLDSSFYLPANTNLMVYWNNEDGNSGDNNGGNANRPSWMYTPTSAYKSVYAYGSRDIWPSTGSKAVNNERPDIKLGIISPYEAYPGSNLGLLSMLEPVEEACGPDYALVKIVLANLGENDYDFSVNNVRLNLQVTDAVEYSLDTVLRTGLLKTAQYDTIELTTMLPIMYAGTYDIKVWLTSNADNIPYDDTLIATFVSDRIVLPLDETFSNGFPFIEFTSTGTTHNKWEVVSSGTYADTVVKPVFGSGMLAFNGTRGAIGDLSTRRLGLANTIDPILEFWYFHDTVRMIDDDNMDIYITIDGGDNFTFLQSVRKYDDDYGWKLHLIDLSSYINVPDACVSVLFQAMMGSGNVTQYIDRIRITSKQDIAINKIIIPELPVCGLKEHEIKVIVKNMTAQKVNFDENPVEIRLELEGTNIVSTHLYETGSFDGLYQDTITMIYDFDFTKGKHVFVSSLTTSLDHDATNNIYRDSIIIDPNYTVRIHDISSSGSPLLADIEMKQEVTIKNTGNMPLPTIDLILSVDAEDIFPPYHFTTTESTDDVLHPGDSVTITFNRAYTTPWSPEYQVHVLAYLHCDPALVRKEAAIPEYVDINNLVLIRIDKPAPGQIDRVNTGINIEMALENRSDVVSFSNITIHARIEDSKGNITDDISENVSKVIDPLHPESHTFSTSYTVPADSVYYITVFIDKQANDNYQQDDTIRMKRITDYKVGTASIDPSKISMSQNFPNPANNSTIINYSIPEAGEVTFRIHSANGQLLYNKTVESEGGSNTIEINTSTLSAGIYMYSMEYKGQRVIKRMSIKR